MDLDPLRPRPCDHLAIARDQVIGGDRVMQPVCAWIVQTAQPQIVDPFQQDDVGDARHGQRIAVEPRKAAWPDFFAQHPIAADARIGDADIGDPLGVQHLGQLPRPAAQQRIFGPKAIGDGIAKGDDRPGVLIRLHQYRRDDFTHGYRLGIAQRRHPGLVVTDRPLGAVIRVGLRHCDLGGQIDADDRDCARLHLQGQRVGQEGRPCGQPYRSRPRKGQRLDAGRIDPTLRVGQGNGRTADRDVGRLGVA